LEAFFKITKAIICDLTTSIYERLEGFALDIELPLEIKIEFSNEPQPFDSFFKTIEAFLCDLITPMGL